MKNYLLGFLLVLALSFDGWGCAPVMPVDGEPNWSFQSPAITSALNTIQDDGVLYLSASDPEVQDVLFSVASFYFDRLKVQIAVTPDHGRPVGFGELSEDVAGQAHTDWACFGSECSNPKYGVNILLDEAFWKTHSYTLHWNVVAHEVGHIISGWGVCYTGEDVDETGTHLGTPLHTMSLTASQQSQWDELDDGLVCSCGAC